MPATPAWPPRSAPRLFVPGPLAAGAAVALDGSQAHYLARVMRVAEGDAVVLCDDLTGEWAARVVLAGKARGCAGSVEQAAANASRCPISHCAPRCSRRIASTWCSKRRPSSACGGIQPVIARRCVADRLNPRTRPRGSSPKRPSNARAPALPELAEPVKLGALLKQRDPARTLFFADELGGAPAREAFAASPGPAALLTGPEGGFDDAEREAIRALPSAAPITLGPRILRGETAAIAAVSLWMAIAGDW